jgi:hypothetical protein
MIREERAASTPSEQARIKLFLRTPDSDEPSKQAGRLARLFGLDTFGTRLLSKRARIEMNWMARLLAFVVLFEILVWTLAWNGLVNNSVYSVTYKTALAVLPASGFAFLTLLFERQMITFDEGSRGRVFYKSLTGRLCYIAIAAFITTQPFELFFFKVPIADRHFEEQVRVEVVRRYSTLSKAEADSEATLSSSQGGTSSEARVVRTQREHRKESEQRAQDELVESDRRLQSAENELRAARSYLGGIDLRLRELRNVAGDNPERLGLESRRAPALAGVDRAEDALRDARIKREGAKALYDKEWGLTDDWRKKLHDRAEEIEVSFREWLSGLQKLRPGEAAPVNSQNWELELRESSLFNDLRILSDLIEGRPPQWKGATKDAREKIAERYKWAEPTECGDGLTVEAQAYCAELARAAKIMKAAYYAAFGFALLIPLAVLFIKWLFFPEGLKIYYSRLNQAAAGDTAAVLATRVLERVKSMERDLP